MADVRPLPNNEMFDSKSAGGGYINAIAYAISEADFKRKAKSYIESYGVKVIEFSNTALLNDIVSVKEIEPILKDALNTLGMADDDVSLGSLHVYPRDDAEQNG